MRKGDLAESMGLRAIGHNEQVEFFAMVEETGIEPCRSVNLNLMMAREFGCYRFWKKPLGRFPSSTRVLPNPLQSWKHFGDARQSRCCASLRRLAPESGPFCLGVRCKFTVFSVHPVAQSSWPISGKA